MRDIQIISFRPRLQLDSESSNDIESFQNNTLRPILKLQQAVTIGLLYSNKHFLQNIKLIDQNNMSDLHEFLKQFLSKDKNLRNKIIGIIIGMMTSDELKFYLDNESELNKRISSMQTKRYADTITQAI